MIFLSASLPRQKENEAYYKSADIIAIRDAIRALATVVIPKTTLIWGGHPSITPLIRYVLERLDYQSHDHVTLYQSEYFREEFPEDNKEFEKIVYTQAGLTKDESLSIMRKSMLDRPFKAGIFIGGMEGVVEEYNLFTTWHKKALVLPVASTGGAALDIYERSPERFDQRLRDSNTYLDLFSSLLADVL